MNFLLGSDGYLFQLHTGHADQNRYKTVDIRFYNECLNKPSPMIII